MIKINIQDIPILYIFETENPLVYKYYYWRVSLDTTIKLRLVGHELEPRSSLFAYARVRLHTITLLHTFGEQGASTTRIHQFFLLHTNIILEKTKLRYNFLISTATFPTILQSELKFYLCNTCEPSMQTFVTQIIKSNSKQYN